MPIVFSERVRLKRTYNLVVGSIVSQRVTFLPLSPLPLPLCIALYMLLRVHPLRFPLTCSSPAADTHSFRFPSRFDRAPLGVRRRTNGSRRRWSFRKKKKKGVDDPSVASLTSSRVDRESTHRWTRLSKHWRALSGKAREQVDGQPPGRPASMTLVPSSSTLARSLPCTDCCLQLPFLPSDRPSPPFRSLLSLSLFSLSFFFDETLSVFSLFSAPPPRYSSNSPSAFPFD